MVHITIKNLTTMAASIFLTIAIIGYSLFFTFIILTIFIEPFISPDSFVARMINTVPYIFIVVGSGVFAMISLIIFAFLK